jgi:hypothetical protein
MLELEGELEVWIVDCYSFLGPDTVFWASVRDEQDRASHVCIDRREGSSTRDRLFEGGRHPAKDNVRLIELGAPEEGIIVPLLSRWCDEYAMQGGLHRELFVEELRNALMRIGDSD